MARSRRNKHPIFDGKPCGVWVPEAVGVVQGYPKTEATWQAQSDRLRKNVVRYNAEGLTAVPAGWGGRRKEMLAIRAKAPAKAARIYKKMQDNDAFIDLDPGTDPARAEMALKGFIEIATDRTQSARDRLVAYKALADFTKVKPSSTLNVNVPVAEAFLDSLIGK